MTDNDQILNLGTVCKHVTYSRTFAYVAGTAVAVCKDGKWEYLPDVPLATAVRTMYKEWEKVI